jgi:hypothetical protein
MFENLEEYQWGNDEDLLSLGLERWEESTIDSVRELHFLRSLGLSFDWKFGDQFVESHYELRLCIKFTVHISDNPHVPTAENFDYEFEGVFLQVLHREGHGMLTEFETRTATMHELRSLIANFTGD